MDCADPCCASPLIIPMTIKEKLAFGILSVIGLSVVGLLLYLTVIAPILLVFWGFVLFWALLVWASRVVAEYYGGEE